MGDFNNPNDNNENQQPNDSNTNQPQYQQPSYQQPQYQQPQYQQPQYGGQSQYQQPNPNPTPGQYQQPYTQYQQPLPNKNNGLAIASMVCGIITLLISCCLWYISLPVAIVGLVLGIISIKNQNGGKGMAIAGLILCGITILVSLLLIITCAALGESFWNELYNEIYYKY